jgi:lipopolysaccharide biosynthesis glycosyltransferase
MDIAFAFDAAYASYLPAVVESVLRTNTHPDMHLWFAAPLATVRNIEGHLAHQVATRATVHYLIMGEKRLSLGTSILDALGYVGPGANLRLFLADAMPARVTKFLYLDIDVLVDGDLTPLWTVPLGNAVVGAVQDFGIPQLGSYGGPPGMPPDVDPASPYFNSGVLLVNAEQWRRSDVTRRCVDYLKRYRDQLRYPDQDGLNIVCHGAWLELDEKWNFQGLWSVLAALIRPCPDDVRITHYAGQRKPWDADFPIELHRRRYLEIVDHANARLAAAR